MAFPPSIERREMCFRANRVLGRCGHLAFVAIVFAAASTSFAQPDDLDRGIPAGQDDLIAEMLGRGTVLPGECKFSGGSVDGSMISATYACANGQLTVEMRGAGEAGSADSRTEQFAIAIRTGVPAAGFVDALTSRIRPREAAFRWSWVHPRTQLETVLLIAVVVFPTTAVLVGLFTGASILRRRRPVDVISPQSAWAAMLRVGGVIVIVLIGLAGAATRTGSWLENLAVFVGSMSLATFLWLTLSGAFGDAGASRRDWPVVVPFLIALVVREGLTVHSLQEIDVQFAQGPIGRHSIVYPLLQLFFMPIVRDPQWFTMHMNGVLGALACVYIYQFGRQRLRSRTAGFLCAFFLAVDPLVARFSPTDGPYSLLLFCWFSGLALLSASDLQPGNLFAGIVLIGIAATARIEGAVLIPASLLMLDPRSLLNAVWRARLVATSALLIVAASAAIQMYLLAFQLGAAGSAIPSFKLWVEGVAATLSENGRLFVALVILGAISGVVLRRWLGLGAFAAMLLVIAPVAQSGSPIALHRYVPTWTLQALVAGIGAYTLTAWVHTNTRWRCLPALPGVLLAVYVLGQHRSDLTRPYVFTEEYELVRSHLGPGALSSRGCVLMTFNANVAGDSDIHDFAVIVPEMRVLDCRAVDCIAQVSSNPCTYYVRSAACYYQSAGLTPACELSGSTQTGDPIACMNEPPAAFERSTKLEPLELRTIAIRETFPVENYPRRAEVGLFRVDGRL